MTSSGASISSLNGGNLNWGAGDRASNDGGTGTGTGIGGGSVNGSITSAKNRNNSMSGSVTYSVGSKGNNNSSSVMNYGISGTSGAASNKMNNTVKTSGIGLDGDSGDGLTKSNGTSNVTTMPTGFSYIWYSMIQTPIVYLLLLPTIFIILAAVGWTRPNYVEDQVSQIWIPQRGQYAKDWAYAESIDGNEWEQAVFAAMAISNRERNLLNEYDLETIRSKMVSTESVTVTYKNETYTWNDICAVTPAPYEMPCARLSPMDLFYEANWFFNESSRLYWYNELIVKQLAMPRINRFGILMTSCHPNETNVCEDLINYRLQNDDINSTLYNPSSLIGDVGNLELSNKCRICLEENYTETIHDIHVAWNVTLTLLDRELNRSENNDPNIKADIGSYIQLKQTQYYVRELIKKNITKNDIDEFHYYYTIRSLYASLGYPTYMSNYKRLEELFTSCIAFGALMGFTHCPSINTSKEEAIQALKNHADHTYSSITTGGVPYPMYGAPGDGTTYLLTGNEPVSGSGVNMSGTITSTLIYFDFSNYNISSDNNTVSNSTWNPPYYSTDGFINFSSPQWKSMILTNPMFAWFTSDLDPAEGYMCGNEYLLGTNASSEEINNRTRAVAIASTDIWCNDYTIPNVNNSGTGNYTRQYFAKMWYDRLLDSESLLNIKKGVSDPYSWTSGAGCGYELGGERHRYTNMSEDSILFNASRDLYFYDEGVVLGVVRPELLIGNSKPQAGQFSQEYPLETVGVLQTIYAAAQPSTIQRRVKSCKRPGGGVNISRADAKEILFQFKQAMEEEWSYGWEDPSNNVTFVCFFDDTAVGGTAARLLQVVTMDNTALMAVSTALIGIFSIIFLFSFDVVESRILITLVGVSLVVLGYFAGLGLGILLGIKINVSVAWSLPFIIIGLGVNDVYLVLMSLKKQKGYTDNEFINTMKEIVVPVSMTSFVNISMFAILNISDIPAVYITARMAILCLLFLYWAVIFCYPAYCYLDLKRQASGRMDVFFCFKHKKANNIDDSEPPEKNVNDFHSAVLYDYFYRPIMLGDNDLCRKLVHFFIIASGITLVVVGCIGVSQHKVGVGLEDLFPQDNQAALWAQQRNDALASWSINIQWGQNDYTDPDIQMQMIKQFEDIVATRHVTDIDTKQLWIAEFALWASRLCEENVRRRDDFDIGLCGYDQIFKDDDSVCFATWKINTYGLREKRITSFDNETVCYPSENGICRPASELHPDDLKEIIILNPSLIVNQTMSFCPTIDSWSVAKWEFCLVQWRNVTGTTNGGLIVEDVDGSPTECPGEYSNDQSVMWPMPFVTGPTMFAYDLFTHGDTIDMMNDVRAFCDHHPTIHCWMQGIPFDYWTQYIGIYNVLTQLCIYSTVVGFAISFLFLYVTLNYEGLHERPRIFLGTLIGAFLITCCIAFSLVTVIGLSVLSGVRLTGFSNMSFVLSVGFSVEYSVHVVSRWLRAELSEKTSLDRVRYTMSFLMLPTFLSFASSTIGVVCLAFTEFEFVQVFFFRPLIIVMFATYFFGCWWLPVVLVLIDIDSVKLGKAAPKRIIMADQSRDGDKLDEGGDNYSYENYNENQNINHSGNYNDEIEDNSINDKNLEESPLDSRNNNTKVSDEGRETEDYSEEDDNHVD